MNMLHNRITDPCKKTTTYDVTQTLNISNLKHVNRYIQRIHYPPFNYINTFPKSQVIWHGLVTYWVSKCMQAINMHRMCGGVRVKADIRPNYNHLAHDHGAYKSMEHSTKTWTRRRISSIQTENQNYNIIYRNHSSGKVFNIKYQHNIRARFRFY